MTPDEAIEKARWYGREDIATTLREEANVLADEVERLRERVGVLEAALRATVELAEWMSGSSDFDALGNWAEGRATCDNSRRILEGC